MGFYKILWSFIEFYEMGLVLPYLPSYLPIPRLRLRYRTSFI